MPQRPHPIASRFASALDAEDYATARRLLAETCIYRLAAETLIGPDAIIDSYRKNGESARQRFDAVQYASKVKAAGPSTATITYTDRLRLGDQWHEFHCRQRVRIGTDGLVEEITHEELPGERERLKDFEGRNPRPGA